MIRTMGGAVALAAAAALAGCAAPSFPGRAPTPLVSQFLVSEARLDLSAAGTRITAGEVAALTALPDRAPTDGARRVALAAPPEGTTRMAQAADALGAAGIAADTRVDPGLSVLRATAPRYAPQPRRCQDWNAVRLRHPIDALFPNPAPHDEPVFGCANEAALDAMAARPTDLVEPPATEAPARGDAAGGAVERYRTIGPTPLPDRSLSEL